MFKKDGVMFKWICSVNVSQDEAFNKQAADKFRSIGWNAKANLSDGQILNRKKNPAFGDVDVLAWDESQKRVLIVECKDLSFDKTIGEIARRLSNYKGTIKANGNRDELKKNLDRCEDIEKNVTHLTKHFVLEVDRITRIWLFSQSTPI